MKERILTFNILTFDHPATTLTLHFSDKERDDLTKVFHTSVPDEVVEHFGQQEHYYTSFDSPMEGAFAVTKDCNPTFNTELTHTGREKKTMIRNVCFPRSLLKKYYNLQIKNYFQNLGLLVQPNFVSDIQVWVPSTKKHPQYDLYDKYTLRVSIATVTDNPELLFSYSGVSKVFKLSAAELLQEVSAEALNWLIYDNSLVKFEDAPEHVRADLDNAFPVWNFSLREELRQQAETPEFGNRYKTHDTKIKGFITAYINKHAFVKEIPINGIDFIKVKRVGTVDENSNQLLFGKKNGIHQKGIVPHFGIKQNGPFSISPHQKIQFFYIMHKEDEDAAKKVDRFLSGKEASFGGLNKYAKTYYGRLSGFSILFENKSNPVPEIEAGLRTLSFQSDTRYIAIYISPINKFDTDSAKRKVYYQVKELLLKFNATSQVIEAEKVRTNKAFHYSMPNIAIAILSKLDGMPWQLDTTLKNELVVGIGAFKHTETNVQFIGSAFSFQNNGKFNRFECFREKQTTELAGSIIRAVNEYAAVNSEIDRLIIHFYKSMSKAELEPIEDGLNKLEFDFPIFIVSINKTESIDIIAFDYNWPQLMPQSGSFVNIGYNKYLLFNNTRYAATKSLAPREGFPFPIKLKIDCNNPELVKDNKAVRQLIDQVYQFSRMYWKSVSQQNLPVTIKYPEMVAEMFPYFSGREIPPFGKDNLWFL